MPDHRAPQQKETPVFPRTFLAAKEVPVGPGTIPTYILNDADELIEYAKRLLEQRLFEFARALFKRAIDLEPTNVNAHNYLAITYRVMGEYDSAIFWLKRALPLNPTCAETYLNLAWVCYQSGRVRAAARLFVYYLEYQQGDEETKLLVHRLLENIKKQQD